jgi:hypothetical protein
MTLHLSETSFSFDKGRTGRPRLLVGLPGQLPVETGPASRHAAAGIFGGDLRWRSIPCRGRRIYPVVHKCP